MFHHILVPLDGSPLAEQALPFATSILAPQGKLTLLSVVPVPAPTLYGLFSYYGSPFLEAGAEPSTDYTLSLQALTKETQTYLNQIALGLIGAESATIKTQVETGDPAAEIVCVAERDSVEAIVISTHGRSGINRWLFGSVTSRVLEAAPCAVLVVPSKRVQQYEPLQAASAHYG
jgi:nucleotide-binding universal stress UspA family protein